MGIENLRQTNAQINAKTVANYRAMTSTNAVLHAQADFGGLFDIGDGKVLVSCANGVGAKLKIAFALNRHDLTGQDCVALCVNDIICYGAVPLFFLDNISLGKAVPERINAIVSGIAAGCKHAGCALLGGETIEVPGMYKADEYDISGFAVGIVEKDKRIDGSKISEGDVLIGLASSGVHAAGFSLIRSTFSLDAVALSQQVVALNKTFGEELLTPTREYAAAVQMLTRRFDIHGIAHIAGGGWTGSLPRVLPEGLGAKIQLGAWPVLTVFELIAAASKAQLADLFDQFNMGVGLVLVVAPQSADAIIRLCEECGEKAYKVGSVVSGKGVLLAQ